MKSIKHLKEQVTDFQNLFEAYLKARKNKRYRDEVLKYSAHLEDNLFHLQEQLINQTYTPGRCREKVVIIPKKRIVTAQPFQDRVAQWAFYKVVNPRFASGYITDTYACIKGRGQFDAADRLHYWMQQVSRKPTMYYYLKLDISKFFYRQDHEVTRNIIGKKINYNAWGMWLVDTFIAGDNTPFGLPPGKGPMEVEKKDRLYDKGFAPGALFSQMAGNIVLDRLDQYCKRQLSIHYYIRYMDDIIILSDSKPQLHEWKSAIEKYLNEQLLLHLNEKTCIRPVGQGVEFCGFRVFPNDIFVRKFTALHMKHNLKRVMREYAEGTMTLERAQQTVNSYQGGLLSHCNSYNLSKAIFGEYSDTEWTEGWFVLKRNSDKPPTE